MGLTYVPVVTFALILFTTGILQSHVPRESTVVLGLHPWLTAWIALWGSFALLVPALPHLVLPDRFV